MRAIVQINFDYDSSFEALIQGSTTVASKFLEVEGLLWKVWLGNDQEKGAGGIYLFANRANADAYAQSDMVAFLRKQQSNVVVKVFDVLEEPSVITNAPLLT